MLRARSSDAAAKVAAHLWDESSGIFVNRFSSGAFNPRISPTSFYPLLAGVASSERATSMMTGWMLNASRFCVTANGDFIGNNASGCYWGLPSISADDPAFPALGYVRQTARAAPLEQTTPLNALTKFHCTPSSRPVSLAATPRPICGVPARASGGATSGGRWRC